MSRKDALMLLSTIAGMGGMDRLPPIPVEPVRSKHPGQAGHKNSKGQMKKRSRERYRMMKEEILSLTGEFTWDFGNNFFIETDKGNFIWCAAKYGGNNSMHPTKKTVKQFFGEGYGRSKGSHKISDYCGDSFHVVEKK